MSKLRRLGEQKGYSIRRLAKAARLHLMTVWQADTSRRAPMARRGDGIYLQGRAVRIPLLSSLLIFISATLSFAHGGGLDTYGCHHDRKQGGYHCHRGPLAGRAFSSKEEMLGVLQQITEPREPVAPAPSAVAVKVVNVVDGDTIDVCCVQGRKERVRYIGVNTAETYEYYFEVATAANRMLVEGKTVRLELDVQERDRYGRLLAYVYLEDGTFVNAWLVENGYAQVMTIPPNVKHQDLFLRCQQEAKEAGRGLWGK